MQKYFTPDQLNAFLNILKINLTNNNPRIALECDLLKNEDGHQEKHIVQINAESWTKGPRITGVANVFAYERNCSEQPWVCYGSDDYNLACYHPKIHGETLPAGFDEKEEILYTDRFFDAWLPAIFPQHQLSAIRVLSD